MHDPSIRNWDRIYEIMLNPHCKRRRYVWEAVVAIDPTCPRVMLASPNDPTVTAEDRWTNAPNRFIVARAIQEAIDCREEPDERPEDL